MKRVWENHMFLWRLCFKTAPGYMIYFLYDAFRYQFIIFLEHTLGIQYVLHCAEYGEPFWKAFLVIGVILLINMIQIIPDGYFIHGSTFRVKPKIYKALKEKMYEKAAQLDLSCYDNPKYYNDFVLAVAEAETSIERFLTLLNSIVQSITIIITTGVFFLLTDAVGILFVLASFVMNFLLAKVLNKLNYEVRLKVNPWERKRNYVSRVFYLNDYAKELRLHSEVGDILEKDFEEANEEMLDIQRKVSKKRVGLTFAQGYLAGDFIIDGLYIAYLIFQAAVLHTIDYSSAVVLFNRTGSLRRGMRGIAEIAPKANENSLYVDKIRSFLEYEPEIKHGIGDIVPVGAGEISLQNVSFRYTPESEEILHDITLEVKAGEKIAIVGYNGAGKTTLIKLLMRLYDPSEGSIRYHGRDIKDYDLDDYHKRIGVVFQDYKMYGASLLENVVLDDVQDAEEEAAAVTVALEHSGFGERLAALPQGLDTPITTEFDEKGVNLSGGESQKVAIARAFYKQADILVMDEPSSALDPIAEYNLNRAMHEAAVNKTVFYISHRLSTTRDADRIIMLEHGSIIEQGTHAQLLAMNGQYARMWHAQAGKYGG
ncbi:MAG: ABC transporter ATP-binding protein [Lachnospiraceae bacterium]|nr:ABC transporter ATP-binding protein [Lachnospiraceae bacterium]